MRVFYHEISVWTLNIFIVKFTRLWYCLTFIPLLHLALGRNICDFYDLVPRIMRELLSRFNDESAMVVKSASDVLLALSTNISAEIMVEHIEFMRNAIASLVSDARRRRGGVGDGEFLYPKFAHYLYPPYISSPFTFCHQDWNPYYASINVGFCTAIHRQEKMPQRVSENLLNLHQVNSLGLSQLRSRVLCLE